MKKNYLLGILGALIGGLIASIPWIAIYVYGNMMYSILTVLIALGALKGYQLLGGKTSKGLPVIIGVISLICVSLANLLIIPIMLIIKEGLPPTIANLSLLYTNSEFTSALIGDYVIAILFTFLGISGVIGSMYKQIKEQGADNVKFNFKSNNASSKDLKKIKEYFVDHNATSEEKAIKLTGKEDLHNGGIEQLKLSDVIVEENGKYFYDIEKEKKNKRQVAITLTIIFGVIFAVIILLIVLGSSSSNNSSNNNTANNTNTPSASLNYKEPDGYQKYEEDDGTYYLPKSDLSGKTGLILLYDVDGEYSYSEELVESIRKNLEVSDDVKSVRNTQKYKNKNNLQILEYEVELTDSTDIIYYIFGEKTTVVEAYTYKEGTTINEDSKALVDSFKK